MDYEVMMKIEDSQGNLMLAISDGVQPDVVYLSVDRTTFDSTVAGQSVQVDVSSKLNEGSGNE